ncbi:MAG: hypothetical protein IAE79_20850 [Anaerolinea sp.]|nr:hypothetical protein [Anaerolinea sp.]
MKNSETTGDHFIYYALSDANVVPDGPGLDAMLAAQKQLICNRPALPATAMSYEQARLAAWDYLEQRVGAANLAEFRGLPEVATAVDAQIFALAAAADSRPDGALAGLLIAYEKAPNNPMLLVNAAGVLNMLDMPNLALAFLNQADVAPGEFSDTMNIPGAQVAANNRAHAHMSLKQWAQAEAILRPVVAAGTELSEARTNLSIALLCQNKDEEAAHYYRLGARRQLVDEDEEINGRLPLDRIYDTSAGETPTLPPPAIPAGTGTLAATAGHYQGEAIDLVEDGNHIVEEQEILIEQIEERRANEPALTTIRFVNVVSAITSADQEPALLALEADFTEAENDLLTMLDRHGDEYLDLAGQGLDPAVFFSACRTLLNGQWAQQQGALHAYADARRTHAHALYEVQTGLSANLIDPLHHAYASLMAEADANNAQFDITNTTATITGDMAALWDYCEGFRDEAFPPPAEPTLPRSAECPPFVRGVKLSIKVGDMITFSVTCEKVEMELGTSGALGYFSQITYNTRDESLTLFAGAKQKLPGGLGLVELGAKEGLYIRADAKGQIADVGVKVSTSGGLSDGFLAGKVDGPGVELSFVSAYNYLTDWDS